MIDLTLTLAAQHPHAHEQESAAESASLAWALAQRNGIGDPYGNAMVTRLRRAFRRGVLGQERPSANSNYDTPLQDAYRAGAELAKTLRILRPSR